MITAARRRGLLTLFQHDPTPCFRSNAPVPEQRLLYWQTADWLVDSGYASFVPNTGEYQLTLTDEGRELARPLA